MNKYSKLFKQIFLFGVVGITSLLIDLIVTSSLFNLLHFPAYLAACIGFLSAFFFNFPINRKHVFVHSDNDMFSLRMQVTLYALLSLFNLVVTGVLAEGFVVVGQIPIEAAKIITTGLIAAWNFVLFRTFIFAGRKNT